MRRKFFQISSLKSHAMIHPQWFNISTEFTRFMILCEKKNRFSNVSKTFSRAHKCDGIFLGFSLKWSFHILLFFQEIEIYLMPDFNKTAKHTLTFFPIFFLFGLIQAFFYQQPRIPELTPQILFEQIEIFQIIFAYKGYLGIIEAIMKCREQKFEGKKKNP